MKQVKRDQDIFKFLVAGIATREHILNMFFRKDDGSLCHIRTVDARLQTLCEQEYLKRRIYKGTKSRFGIHVYALDERGVSEAANNFNIERDYIRYNFPRQIHLSHELYLADIFRTFYREKDEKKYGIGYLWDENELKSRDRLNRIKYRKYYADGAVMIMPPTKDNLAFFIELDAGDKNYKYWRPKIASLKENALVFALNPGRLETLKGCVIDSGRKHAVGFALAGDFIKKGLAETRFDWYPEKTNSKLELV